MSSGSVVLTNPPAAKSERVFLYWRWAVPVLVALVLALLPAPAGLSQHAWWFFSLFAGVVAALIIEPVPPAATGFIAIALTADLCADRLRQAKKRERLVYDVRPEIE